MFGFLKTKIEVLSALAFLQTDMHSHLIPAIDDGSKSIEESRLLIDQLKYLGFKKLFTTPHIYSEYYPNTPEIILSGLENLKEKINLIDIDVDAAAEYYVDEQFIKAVESGDKLLTFSKNKILIEYSMLAELPHTFSIIFDLKTKGYHPIIAHPERYLYFGKQIEKFVKMKEMGAELQVNLLSLSGHYGPEQKKLGIELIKLGLVDYLGTDLHRISHIESIRKMLGERKMRKLIEKYEFKNHLL